MKKNSKNFHLNINMETYKILREQAKLNNQSMTKYIESLIAKKEKFNPQIIKTIDKIYHIVNQHIKNYKILTATASNCNQLMYFININEQPKQKEIIDTIENLKNAIKTNVTNTNHIIETLKPYCKQKNNKIQNEDEK